MRLPPDLPLSRRRTTQRITWPISNASVKERGSASSSESESESEEEASEAEISSSSPSPRRFAPLPAKGSDASARVTVPLSPFGREICMPRSVTSVMTPRSFMPTRSVLYLSASTKFLPPPDPAGAARPPPGGLAPARPKGPCDDGEERGGSGRVSVGVGGRGAAGGAEARSGGATREGGRRSAAATGSTTRRGRRRGARGDERGGVASRGPGGNWRGGGTGRVAHRVVVVEHPRALLARGGFRFRAVAPAAASREGRLLGVIVRPVSLRPHRGRASTRGRATFARGLSLELSRVAVRTPRVASCARRAPHRHRLVGCGGEAHHDGRRDRSPKPRKLLRAARFPAQKSPRGVARDLDGESDGGRESSNHRRYFSRFTRLRGHVPAVLSRLGQLDPSRVAGAQIPTYAENKIR